MSEIGRPTKYSKELYPIEGYTSYFINKNNDIISTKWNKEKILKPHNNNRGYQDYCFVENKKRTHILRHRIIAKAFIPNPDKKPIINHINGIKTDNRIENLEWCTYSENEQHAHRTGLKNPPKGKDHWNYIDGRKCNRDK